MYGLFAAMTPAGENIVPGAFSRHPGRSDSPFPVQVRFNIVLECPPIHDSDKDLRSIFFNRPIAAGPIQLKETRQLANLFAARAGAFSLPIASEPSRMMQPPQSAAASPSQGPMHARGDGNFYRPPHKFVECKQYLLLLILLCLASYADSGVYQHSREPFRCEKTVCNAIFFQL